MNELFTMTARDLACAIRDKRLGVEELTRAYMERIDQFDRGEGLNTVAELNSNAIVQARKMDSIKTSHYGAMFGLPVLIKDNISTGSPNMAP